jgi:hypothetical protein
VHTVSRDCQICSEMAAESGEANGHKRRILSVSYLEEIGTLLSIACNDASASRPKNQGLRSRQSPRAHLSRFPERNVIRE